eukprot:c43910_g1_i1 orf=65-259(+)
MIVQNCFDEFQVLFGHALDWPRCRCIMESIEGAGHFAHRCMLFKGRLMQPLMEHNCMLIGSFVM